MDAPFGRSYFDVVSEWAAQRPSGLAIIADDVEVSYSSLETEARQIGGALRQRGIRRGDRVGLLLNNSAEWIKIFLGVSAAGGTVVPLSTWSKEDELNYLIGDSNIRILFIADQFAGVNFAESLSSLVPEADVLPVGAWRSARFPSLAGIVVLGSEGKLGWETFKQFLTDVVPIDPSSPPGERASVVDDALILYTSGSTSRPKGVRVVNCKAIENGFNIGERQRLQSDDRLFLASPLFWYFACGNALVAVLTHGATIVVQARFDSTDALQLIEKHRCTAIYTLPVTTRKLVDDPSFAPHRTRSLRTGATIGTPQDFRLAAETLGARSICNIYGLTEAYGNSTVTWCDTPLNNRANCQGPPLPGMVLRIVDPETRIELTAEGVGEVEIGGYVSPGYTGTSSKLNDQFFTRDGYFRTGDLGFIDSAGDFHFVGRNSEIIKSGGINISPAEIENILRQHPAVGEAIVVGANVPIRGEAIVAFVVMAKGATVSSKELQNFCKARVSSYKVPDIIEFRDSLPTTTTGKFSRRELKLEAAVLVSSSQPG